MKIESARLAYVPFRRFPAGHVFLTFRFIDGKELVISPEADVQRGSFSIVRGVLKTYRMQYQIDSHQRILEKYRKQGRRVEEYPLQLTQSQLSDLYQHMTVRADILSSKPEWYHTLFNSCITNVTDHVVRVSAVSFTTFDRIFSTFAPVRAVRKLQSVASHKRDAETVNNRSDQQPTDFLPGAGWQYR